jgi:hypothetical protein
MASVAAAGQPAPTHRTPEAISMRALNVIFLIIYAVGFLGPVLAVVFGDRSKRKQYAAVSIVYLAFMPLQFSIWRSYADAADDKEDRRIKHEFRFKCPSLNNATLTPGEKDAIEVLRRIETAEEAYIAKYRMLGDSKALADEGLIEAHPVVEGYKITLVLESLTGGDYSIKAEVRGVQYGKNSFNLSDDGVVRFQGGFIAPPHGDGCPVYLGPT